MDELEARSENGRGRAGGAAEGLADDGVALPAEQADGGPGQGAQAGRVLAGADDHEGAAQAVAGGDGEVEALVGGEGGDGEVEVLARHGGGAVEVGVHRRV